MKKFLDTGEIVGTHGVRGEVRLHPWSDSPEFMLGFKRLYLDPDGGECLTVTRSRVHGNVVIVKIKGVDDIPAAEKLRGKVVYVARKDVKLEKGAYFVQDLLGCEVFDADSGARYGEISDVSKTGANDVWHISNGGRETLIPVIDDVVIDVDVEGGRVTIRPLKGLFDDED